MEDPAQRGAQQVAIEHLGQDLVPDAAQAFGDEAGIGQDARRRVQIRMPVRRAQFLQLDPNGTAKLRIERQDVAKRLQIAPCRFDVGKAARADPVDQFGEEVDWVAVRLGKGGEYLFHDGPESVGGSPHEVGRMRVGYNPSKLPPRYRGAAKFPLAHEPSSTP